MSGIATISSLAMDIGDVRSAFSAIAGVFVLIYGTVSIMPKYKVLSKSHTAPDVGFFSS